MLEIRFHGRGGQGAVVASIVLASAFFKEGKFVQAFPSFGAERRGAPVVAFTRVERPGDPGEIWHLQAGLSDHPGFEPDPPKGYHVRPERGSLDHHQQRQGTRRLCHSWVPTRWQPSMPTPSH